MIRSDASHSLAQIAAKSLGRIFDAPAVVMAEKAGKLWPAGASGGAKLSVADQEAAHWALANDKPTRAETYPFDQAGCDFWPMQARAKRRLVLGVKLIGRAEGRPATPDRYVELVAGYLAVGSDS